MSAPPPPKDAPLRAEGLVAGYGGPPVVNGIDLAVRPGELLSLIGPNGSGKSTLLKCLARLHTVEAGGVWLEGAAIQLQPTREVARRLALLPQEPTAPQGLTVRELVGLGRHPYRHWLTRDWDGPEAVEAALRETGIVDLAERTVETLSGGQRQRAWIALALAQGAKILLLDEPTNHLDPAHRSEVMETLVRLAHNGGRSIVVVLHDLILAARVSDRVAVLDQGRLAALGAPGDVMSADLLGQVYGTSFTLLTDPHSGRPVPIQKIGRAAADGTP